MAGKRKKHSADLLAGIIVILVAILLMVAVVIGFRQCTALLPVPSVVPTAPPTTAPTQPPKPTLAKNPYSAADFGYNDNGYLTCLSGESWLGVDVSEHQGSINWEKVAATEVQFAMVRLAYRGWGSEGLVRPDARGLENLDGAAAAGLQVGVYFFSQAITVEEAIEEARFLLELLDGRALDMPVVFDWETVSSEEARTANMNRKTLNACAMAFCQEIEAAGYQAMLYYNLDMAKWKFDLLPFQEAGYEFWLAMYTDRMNYSYRVRMWQYTNQGRVDGIKGRVDLNLYFPGP